MSSTAGIGRRAARLIGGSLDLLGLWWALLLVQPFVPRDAVLARADLAPWGMLTLGLAVLLRGRAVGDGPHPMLRVRRSGTDALLRRLGAALIPAALLCFYDAPATLSPERAGLGLALAALSAAGLALGRADGATAWNPGGHPAMSWAVLALLGPLGAGTAGLLRVMVSAPLGAGLLIGLGFGIGSLALGRPVHLSQRRAAGRRDHGPWRPRIFAILLAFTGPALALGLLLALGRAWVGDVGFELAFLASLFVTAWAAVVWPRPRPVARYCLLHELVPMGGRDEPAEEGARAFDAPPEGALRLDPLSVRRTRKIHSWLVPVQDARIGELDDPVRPLWRRQPSPLPSHVLGEAAFLPDPRSREPQDEEITVQLRGNRETAALRGGDVQSRRLVVLRAFPPPGVSRRGVARTWRWERRIPAASLQVVDAGTRALSLRDGDVLVLSTEGVARAFEVELGERVTAGQEPSPPRPPQLEDYCGVGL